MQFNMNPSDQEKRAISTDEMSVISVFLKGEH